MALSKVEFNWNLWGLFQTNEQKSIYTPQKTSVEIDFTEVVQSKEIKEFKQDWKKLVSSNARVQETIDLEKSYAKEEKKHPSLTSITYKSLLGRISYYSNFLIWMPGLALLANYLAKKKDLQGLIVCSSEKTLFKKIEEIIQSNKDEKWSLIFPKGGDSPWHKNALFLEKKGNTVNIALMDAIAPSYQEIWDGSLTLLPKIGNLCKRYQLTPNLFYPEVQREFSMYGCAIFSLEDSITFLQDPTFFSKAATTHKVGSTYILKDLPHGYWVGAQSYTALQKHINKHNGDSFSIPGKKKSLLDYLKKYTLINDSGKKENHYITNKMYKYMHFCVSALRELSTEKLQQVMKESLVV